MFTVVLRVMSYIMLVIKYTSPNLAMGDALNYVGGPGVSLKVGRR